jgi:hypothetical protein
MTPPKEKAKELFEKMSKQTYSFQEYAGAHYSVEEIGWEAGKKCALIAVEEILNTLYSIPFGNALDNELEYWEEVKQEIKNK